MKHLQIICLLLCFLIHISGCDRSSDPGSKDSHGLTKVLIERRVMGTTMQLALYSTTLSKSDLEEAAAEAVEEVRRCENLMSSWVKESDVNRINAAKKGEWIEVDETTFDVIEKAVKTCEITSGAFDITVSPLVDLWGFGAKSKGGFAIPSDEEIAEAMKKVGHKNILLDRKELAVSFMEDGITIDLAGIAKGYAVDRAISVLKKNGVNRAMVEIGGEVGIVGKNKEGKKWRVGVQHPLEKGHFLTVLELEDECVATSGDYMNFYIVDGVRYSHILDPRTGQPTRSNIASVTVVGKSCADLDALGTGLAVLPYEEGIEILENLPEIEGIIVHRDGDDEIDVYISDGLKEKVKLLEY